jgi:hypothetical protein
MPITQHEFLPENPGARNARGDDLSGNWRRLGDLVAVLILRCAALIHPPAAR